MTDDAIELVTAVMAEVTAAVVEVAMMQAGDASRVQRTQLIYITPSMLNGGDCLTKRCSREVDWLGFQA